MMDKLTVLGEVWKTLQIGRENSVTKLKLSRMSEKPTTGPSTKGMIKIAETKIVKAEWDVREAKEWTVYGRDDIDSNGGVQRRKAQASQGEANNRRCLETTTRSAITVRNARQ